VPVLQAGPGPLECALDRAGERLFGETGGTKPLRLTDARSLGDGIAYLTYETA
jgi:hypothetical protein